VRGCRCLIDTIYELIYTRHRPRRGESNFRIEIIEKNQPGQKGEFEKLLPELALLSGLILLEYFYTKIRFSTPALSVLLGLAGQIYMSFKIQMYEIKPEKTTPLAVGGRVT
jgi:hypothetical protein